MKSDQCMRCKHYWGAGRCDAYQETPIPYDIISGRHMHTSVFEGDKGIRFELDDKYKGASDD